MYLATSWNGAAVLGSNKNDTRQTIEDQSCYNRPNIKKEELPKNNICLYCGLKEARGGCRLMITPFLLINWVKS